MMIFFTLELVNLFIFFKYVLGYEFRKNQIFFAIGVCVILAGYGLRFALPDSTGIALTSTLFAITAVLPVCFFKERFFLSITWSVFIQVVLSLIETFFWGIWIIAEKGEIWNLNFELATFTAQIAGIIVLGSVSVYFKYKHFTIQWDSDRITLLLVWASAAMVYICQIASGYSGAVDENVAQMIQGTNMARSGLIGIFVIIVCILAICLHNEKRELKRELCLNEKCIEEQSRQYALIGEKDQQLRQFRHDYNRHITSLQTLLRQKDFERLGAYILDLGAVNTGLNFISTNNIICDAIVNQYHELCSKENIRLSVLGKFPLGLQVSEVDLCVILSNGMENAYEATQKCEGERVISLLIRNHGNMVLIRIDNPVCEPPKIKEGMIETTKKDKMRHGLGTKNMRETTEKNGGSIKWECNDEGVFSVQIMLLCGNK